MPCFLQMCIAEEAGFMQRMPLETFTFPPCLRFERGSYGRCRLICSDVMNQAGQQDTIALTSDRLEYIVFSSVIAFSDSLLLRCDLGVSTEPGFGHSTTVALSALKQS
jgi:hypothetical protein